MMNTDKKNKTASESSLPRTNMDAILKTQSIQIKKQALAIAILVRIVDELRQPYNNGNRHDLYLLATDGLNELERMEIIQ